MPAPTFVQEAETNFGNNTSPETTPSRNVLAGDVLVALAGMEHASPDIAISDNQTPDLAWVLEEDPTTTNTSAFPFTKGWSHVLANLINGLTITFTRSSGTAWFGANVLTFRNSDGIGAATSKTSSSNQVGTISITTTEDNSAIAVIVVDWNALDGASRVWATVNGIAPTPPTIGNGFELSYFRNTSNYATYVAYYPDAGAAGAKTVGITTPGSTMRPSVVAIEILGTTGDITVPVVTLASGLTFKMSDESGKDSYGYDFQANEAIQAWKIKVVSSSGDEHTAGTQVEAGGAVAANTPITGSITYAELVAAGVGAEGNKVLKFFCQDLAGNWSA